MILADELVNFAISLSFCLVIAAHANITQKINSGETNCVAVATTCFYQGRTQQISKRGDLKKTPSRAQHPIQKILVGG